MAEQLEYDYFDRQILADAAGCLGTTEDVLAARELPRPRLTSRIGSFLDRIVAGAASSTIDDDIIPGPTFSAVLGQDYPAAVAEPSPTSQRVEDRRFLEVTVAVVRELADAGNVVIIGRASNIILNDRPDALHIGLVATLDSRVRVVVEREGMTVEEARRFAMEAEQARLKYFRRYFHASADDPGDFHMMLNTHLLERRQAVEIIINAVEGLSSTGLGERH